MAESVGGAMTSRLESEDAGSSCWDGGIDGRSDGEEIEKRECRDRATRIVELAASKPRSRDVGSGCRNYGSDGGSDSTGTEKLRSEYLNGRTDGESSGKWSRKWGCSIEMLGWWNR